jgi:hypothetical protein
MNIYSQKQIWKSLLLVFAIIIGFGSLWYTNILVKRLSEEERKKVELWAEATRQLGQTSTSGQDINFLVRIIQNNETVPVILTDTHDTIISYRNLDTSKINNPGYLERQLEIMKDEHNPIQIDLGKDRKNYIYYKDSIILTQLSYYPYVQLTVILLFVLIAYYAFSVSRKAEQNQVWVGLSKETAHQLGTPTSSLMAWVEMLKMKNVDQDIISELERDTLRLEKITARFSKIGSKPALKSMDIVPIIKGTKNYLDKRFSERVKISLNIPKKTIVLPVNPDLFEWVVENVCKNAYDAIEGKGIIDIKVMINRTKVYIDICDTGKGIPKSKQKTIFKPGYTTKKAGWGLGLSLSKRIIEHYHCGRIYVLHSEIEEGTTVRIALKKENNS